MINHHGPETGVVPGSESGWRHGGDGALVGVVGPLVDENRGTRRDSGACLPGLGLTL